MDRGFADVQRTFSGHGTTPELLANLLTLVFLLGAAIVLGWLLSRWIASRRVTPPPSTWTTGRENILGMLDLALNQRARFDIVLENKAARSRFIPCALVASGDDGVSLELSEVIQLSDEWLDQRAKVYFKLKLEDPDLPSFFGFAAEIVNVGVSPHGATVVTVRLPDRIELRQKRSRLRIEPPFKLVRNFTVWPEQRNEEGSLSQDPRAWGAPLLRLDPKNPRAVRILDISGGGVKVLVQQGTMQQRFTGDRRPQFVPGVRFFIDLGLHDPKTNALLRLLLHATVKTASTRGSSRDLEMGMAFTAEARISAESPDLVEWRALTGDASVESIDNWVFKRHLDLHREKGVA